MFYKRHRHDVYPNNWIIESFYLICIESKWIISVESSDSSNHSLLIIDTNSPKVLQEGISLGGSKDSLEFLCGLFTE